MRGAVVGGVAVIARPLLRAGQLRENRGAGGTEDVRPRLFEQYARAAGTRRSGSGVGLFLVRALAEAQGGRAGYPSHARGGSVFGFSLPNASR